MKNKFLVVGVVIVTILILISIVVGFFIGPIIKTGIETIGTKVVKVPISLNGVGVSILTGSASVNGLIVGNPSGFKTSEAIKLRSAAVSLDLFSVSSQKIKIHSIHIDSPEITFEGGLGGNNLSKIMENVNAVARKGGPDSNKEKPAPKIEVDDFLITGAKVHIYLKGISNQGIVLPLPDIHLTNIGKDTNGATATELIQTVLSHISSATFEEVKRSISSSGKLMQGLVKDADGLANTSVKSITKSLGGLFNK